MGSRRFLPAVLLAAVLAGGGPTGLVGSSLGLGYTDPTAPGGQMFHHVYLAPPGARVAPARQGVFAEGPVRCERCHAEHGARDHVFVQFYPLLRGAPAGGRR